MTSDPLNNGLAENNRNTFINNVTATGPTAPPLSLNWTNWFIIKSMFEGSVRKQHLLICDRMEGQLCRWQYVPLIFHLLKGHREIYCLCFGNERVSLRGMHPYIFLFHWRPPQDRLDGVRGQCLLASQFPRQPTLHPFPRRSGGEWSCSD